MCACVCACVKQQEVRYSIKICPVEMSHVYVFIRMCKFEGFYLWEDISLTRSMHMQASEHANKVVKGV